MNPNSFLDLKDAYYDSCYLQSELDKMAVEYAAILDDSAYLARFNTVRWALEHWIQNYDKGRDVSYGDYLALVLQAQTILEGDGDVTA